THGQPRLVEPDVLHLGDGNDKKLPVKPAGFDLQLVGAVEPRTEAESGDHPNLALRGLDLEALTAAEPVLAIEWLARAADVHDLPPAIRKWIDGPVREIERSLRELALKLLDAPHLVVQRL